MKRPLLVWPLVVACSSSDFVAPPELEGAQTMLVRVDGSERVAAQSFGAPILVELRDEDRYLRLSAYRESLGDLGLAPGAVNPQSCRSCALSSPLAVFDLDTEFPGQAWRRLDVAADEDTVARVLPDAERCDTCTSFSAQLVPSPDEGALQDSLVLGASGERALVVARTGGAAYWVQAEGPPAIACLGSEGAFVDAAYSETPDLVWVADRGGGLSRWDVRALDPSEPCAASATASVAPAGEQLEWIDGSPPGVPYEVFAMGSGGQFHRYYGGVWERIDAPLQGDGRLSVWIAPNRGLGTSIGRRNLWYDNGLYQATEMVLDAYEVQIGSARRDEDMGLVLGTKPFLLLFEDGSGGFRRAASLLPIGERVSAFVRHAGSYFMVVTGGYLRELHPRLGYCAPQALFGEGHGRWMAALSDGTLVVSYGALWRARPVRDESCE